LDEPQDFSPLRRLAIGLRKTSCALFSGAYFFHFVPVMRRDPPRMAWISDFSLIPSCAHLISEPFRRLRREEIERLDVYLSIVLDACSLLQCLVLFLPRYIDLPLPWIEATSFVQDSSFLTFILILIFSSFVPHGSKAWSPIDTCRKFSSLCHPPKKNTVLSV